MISCSLLLNEHKDIQDFGFASPPTPIAPFSYDSPKKINSVTHLALGLYINHILNTMPAEPGALIKHMRTQICTLSVWRGLPYRNEGPGFPVQLKASQMQVANDKIQIKFLFLFCFGFFWGGDPGFVLNSFSAHYATLLCCFFFFCVCVYWLLLLSPLVCLCREEQTSTVSEAEGDRGLIFTFSFTMYSSSMVLT